jgi:hypothetical protein
VIPLRKRGNSFPVITVEPVPDPLVAPQSPQTLRQRVRQESKINRQLRGMGCTMIGEVPDGLQQSTSTRCDGTQIAANTVEYSSPAQVLAHTSPRSRSRCSTQLLIEAEEDKCTDAVVTALLPKANRTCTYSVSDSFRGRRVLNTE